MPRLSNDLYFERHRFLKKAWTDFDSLYALIPVMAQWDLHAFCQPTKTFTKHELIAHRQTITKERPSLPAKSGKSFDYMFRVFRAAFEYANGDDRRFNAFVQDHVLASAIIIGAPDNRGRRIRITAKATPEPNIEKIGLAILERAKEMGLQSNGATPTRLSLAAST